MKTNRIVKSLLVLLMAVTGFSCGTSTEVVSSWKAEGASSNALEKVLVVAMMNDRETKDQIEQIMVNDFLANGISAVTGTSEFGPKGIGNLTQNSMTQLLTGKGYTSVLLVCLVDKEKDVDYVPGTPYISPYGPVYYGFYGRYRYMYDNIYSPAYFVSTVTYTLDADLYTVGDNRLIYSSQSKSYDPTNSKSLAESFSREIIADLKTEGLLIPTVMPSYRQ